MPGGAGPGGALNMRIQEERGTATPIYVAGTDKYPVRLDYAGGGCLGPKGGSSVIGLGARIAAKRGPVDPPGP